MAKSIEVVLKLDNKQYNTAIKQSKNQTKDFESSSVLSAGKIATAFAAIGGGAVLKSIVDVGSSFQDLQNSLNVVFGSVDEGARQFDRITDFAQGTQFSVETLTQAFVQLKGAGVEPTDELLKTFADTASVTTDQMGTFQAALDLVSRSTAGGLGLEDLNRLADRGIPVFNILQEKLGITRLEVSKFGQTAEGANKIIGALTDGLNERFGGALETSSENISRLQNNLGDALNELQAALFGLIQEDLTNGLKALTNSINGVTEGVEKLNEAFGDMEIAFGVILSVVVFVLNPFAKLRVAFNGVKLAGLGAAGAIKKIGEVVAKAMPAFKSFGERVLDTLFVLGGYIILTGQVGELAKLYKEKIFGVTDALKENTDAVLNNAHVLAFEADQEKKAKEEAEKLKVRIDELTSAANAFAKNDYRTELEKLTDRQQKATDAINDLRFAQFLANGELEDYEKLLKAAQSELAQATSELNKFKASTKQVDPLTAFFQDLKDSAAEYVQQQNFARMALDFFSQDIVKATTNATAYEFIINRLNEMLGNVDESLSEGQQAFKDFNDSIGDIVTIKEYVELNEQLAAIMQKYPELFDEASDAKKELDEALSENEGLANFLNTLGQAQVALSKDLATSLVEGKSAAEAFQSFFKKLVVQLIADALRLAIIQPILGSLFGVTFGVGGGVDSLTGGGLLGIFGKRAMGGPVMKNRPYIVGEKGPELFVPGATGNIVPNDSLGGGRAVTYNINAVDAQSFQQLVARDPEFIFAVTEAGRRRLPA